MNGTVQQWSFIMTNKTIQQLIQYIKEQFIPYQNVTLHYEEDWADDNDDAGFNLRITQEYICQCDHCLERRKFLGRQLVTTYPSNCFDLDGFVDLRFEDLLSFRQWLYPVVCLDNFEKHFDFNGSYKDFYHHYDERINRFFVEHASSNITIQDFLDFLEYVLFSDFAGVKIKVKWQSKPFSFLEQPPKYFEDEVLFKDAWLTFIRLFLIDYFYLDTSSNLEQKLIIKYDKP